MSPANVDPRYGSRALAELCTQKTFSEIGAAIYLLGFLRNDQFHRRNPISYSWIAAQTGFNERTLERWMRLLRKRAYARVESGWNGMHVSLRKVFAGVVADMDYELIDTRGNQRPLTSADVARELYGEHFRGEMVRAYQDRDPAFRVERDDGELTFEKLSHSNPPDIDIRRLVRRARA